MMGLMRFFLRHRKSMNRKIVRCLKSMKEYEGNADDDDGLDEVLLQVSQKYEQEDCDQGCDEVLEVSRKEDFDQGTSCDLRQKCSEKFSHCVSDREVEREVRLAVPEKTRQQMIWCYNVWCVWRSS